MPSTTWGRNALNDVGATLVVALHTLHALNDVGVTLVVALHALHALNDVGATLVVALHALHAPSTRARHTRRRRAPQQRHVLGA